MPGDIHGTYRWAVIITHVIDGAKRFMVIKVKKHERADPQTDAVMVPASVNLIFPLSRACTFFLSFYV